MLGKVGMLIVLVIIVKWWNVFIDYVEIVMILVY